MIQRETESAYGTLRRTINYKIKNLHNLKIGHPMIFSSKEEKSFVDHIIIKPEKLPKNACQVCISNF